MAIDIFSRPSQIIIHGQALTMGEVVAVARHSATVTLGGDAEQRIQAARAIIDRIADEGRKIYGVTTGFGHLSKVRIPSEQFVDLQHNLLRSHAAGVGEPLSEDVTRAMMLLLAASLARGYSGVSPIVVHMLLTLLNAHVYP